MRLEKHKVCTECLSPHIVFRDCRCTYDRNYPIIELEFEVCECCGNMKDNYAETPFNEEQFKRIIE